MIRAMNRFLGPIRKILRPVGVAITRPSTLENLVLSQRELARIKIFHNFLTSLRPDAVKSALRLLADSRSENFQDMMAMLILGETGDRFFVEFGATDGIQGSNSYMMEKAFGWSGILAEPARCWHAALGRNRAATISHKCVWNVGDIRLPFRETPDAGFSTLEALGDNNRHVSRRIRAELYEVETTTLLQLLYEHNAPKVIDYLSIDTEGSEFSIVERFDFGQYRPLIATIEHNYGPERIKMISLMSAHDYVRILPEFSAYDDWFICRTLTDRLHSVLTQEALHNVR